MFTRLFLSLIFTLSISTSVLADVELSDTYDLQKLSKENNGDVIIILLSQENCSFCHTVKEDFLKPLKRAGGAPQMAVINLSSNQPIINFNGVSMSTKEASKEMGGKWAPTLLFVDKSGKPVAENIIGINTNEFYAFYIDKSIQEGRFNLKYQN